MRPCDVVRKAEPRTLRSHGACACAFTCRRRVCRGQPDGLVISHLPFGPTAYFGMHHCVLRHDVGTKQEVGTISEVYPNIILHNFSTQIGQRFATVLKALFPVPKSTSKRLVTFANKNDYISFRCSTLILAASAGDARTSSASLPVRAPELRDEGAWVLVSRTRAPPRLELRTSCWVHIQRQSQARVQAPYILDAAGPQEPGADRAGPAL